ncbi:MULTISPECIES: transglycosylase domain-containing protein [Amycolatopsis]|uniref:Membrane peptidoglycan carboxypeptidase n=1 Tax=Amycolatopsis echigonensis TaxID=2576905 RepID=A0A2N3WL59_9PSEU|nr:MULTISPECIES: transglycosylase domain-containing protein [Amycolatopsis]MBB2499961.1 penicillin-binding protein [Amycolatopsis echigonensis]MCG3751120.1 penicillin-binding protein [Amycolatopsis sp. Poz14]PKV94582.1 membrane peptidoglycan carboxypeptidase [Amycolatopsis niigatensis]
MNRPYPPGEPPHWPRGRHPGPIPPRRSAGPGRPADPRNQPEPELLTHRLPAPPPLPAARPRPAGPRNPPPPSGPARPRVPRKKLWRRIRRGLYVLAGVCLLGPVIAFVVAYQFVRVPDPTALAAALNQPVTLYYADGSVMYTKTGTAGNRQLATWDQIPQSMKNAQMAAEDETFMTNSGFDLNAIVRTVWNRLNGGTGGGSTIGQEYVKKATGNDQPTLARKMAEMVESYKMTNTYSKQDILTAYLNTVYFGRGAYGIKAAAKAFYGEDVSKLTNEQAALLAGMVQLPSYADKPAYEQQRYRYVLGRMLANHWLSQAEYDSAAFPAPIAQTSAGSGPALSPTRQYIVAAVFDELAKKGLPEQALSRSRAKIYTSIQPPAQTDAEHAVAKITSADRGYPHEGAALVSVDPSTGGIVAYYGGDGSTSYDLARTPQQPGSSFKPYVLAAGLRTDPGRIGLNTVYDGSDNQTIDGQLVHNSDGEGASRITVKDAMTKSVNTVFYRMGAQAGVNNVRQAAWDAGIPKRITSSLGSAFDSLQQDDPVTGNGTGSTQLGISIGQYPVRPIDQAQGYATFANDGKYLPAHFVTKVTDGTGSQLYRFDTAAVPAFGSDPAASAAIAHTVTASMTDVASSSGDGLRGGRPNAAKTGTAQFNNTGHNSEAWMVGYTPQNVTAVWFGNTQQPAPIYGNYHNGIGSDHGYDVYGREEPGYIWQDFMNAYLAGQPARDFPPAPAGTAAPATTGNPAPATSNQTTPDTPTTAPATTPSTTAAPTTSDQPTSPQPTAACGPSCPTTTPGRRHHGPGPGSGG